MNVKYYLWMYSSNPVIWQVGRGNDALVLEAYILTTEGINFTFENIGWQKLPSSFVVDVQRCHPITETEAFQVVIGGKPIFKLLQEKYRESWNAMQSV